MNLIWTETVPRRLIDRASGNDVTAKMALVYPFTSFDTQARELGDVTISTRNGKTVKEVRKRTRKSSPTRGRDTVATRTPSDPQGEVLAGKRYVQIGSFDAKASAQRQARKLKTLGLPVRIGKLSRGGQTQRLVLAGPFSDDQSAQQALSKAQSAGFSEAFLRR